MLPMRLCLPHTRAKWLFSPNRSYFHQSGQHLTAFRKIVPLFFFSAGFSGCCLFGAAISNREYIRKQVLIHSKLNALRCFPDKFSVRKMLESVPLQKEWKLERMKVCFAMISISTSLFVVLRFPVARRHLIMMEKTLKSGKIYSGWPLLLTPFIPSSLLSLSLHSVGLLMISQILNQRWDSFLAVYLSGNVLGSMASQSFRFLRCQPGLPIGPAGLTALLTCFLSTNNQSPEREISNIMKHSRRILYSLLAFHLFGLIMGWRRLEHGAHLTAAIFGMWYAQGGGLQVSKLCIRFA